MPDQLPSAAARRRWAHLPAGLVLLVLGAPLSAAVPADQPRELPPRHALEIPDGVPENRQARPLQEIAGQYWSEGPFLEDEDRLEEVDRWWEWWADEDDPPNEPWPAYGEEPLAPGPWIWRYDEAAGEWIHVGPDQPVADDLVVGAG
jgi:hypothetical protein